MSNNKRPASSPPPGQPNTRPPPFAGAEPTPASETEARVDPAVEELSVALKEAAESFNKITALLSQQQELLKSASRSSVSGAVFDSFRNSLKALTFIWNRSTPVRLKAPNPALPAQPVSTPLSGSHSGHDAASDPTATSTARLPPRSYASAVRTAKSDPLSVAKVVAAALPNSTPVEVISLASKITARPQPRKPKVRRAPKGQSCSIAVRPSQTISAAKLPLDHQLEIWWQDYARDAPDIPPLRSTRWIPGIGFQFTFTAKPPPRLDEACVSFIKTILGPSLQSTTFTAERFRFRNTVFYKCVALTSRFYSWSESLDHAHWQLSQQISGSHVWKDITIIGAPRLYIPPHTPQFGILYVDFYDDAKHSNLKAILKEPVYLGATGTLTSEREAVNLRPVVQRCSVCQRWGHSAAICRSLTPHCAACAGSHDERQHSTVAPSAHDECFNCKGPHRSDSKDCPFYAHRRDPEWIRSHQPSLRNPPLELQKKKGKKKAS